MQTAWTQNLKTSEEKERFQSQVISARPVLERQTQILEELDKASANAILNMSSYDSPSWAYKAADNNGYRRALRAIKTLINLDQQKANNEPI